MSAATTTPQAASDPGIASPVSGRQRLGSLDLLRGVAVLGILVMNIYAFAMPFPAYMNPYAMGGDEPWNLGTWVLTHVIFDQKFMSIFSMLFGAGIVLMMNRAEARSARFGRLFYSRQFWLLLLGMLHAYLLWIGDILFYYALIGMLVYPFRKAAPGKLIAWGSLLLLVPLAINYATSYYVEEMISESAELEALEARGEELSEAQAESLEQWRASRPFLAPTDEDIEADLEAYGRGYVEIVEYRAPQVLGMHLQATPFFMLWRIGGLMLIGMALMKLGVFSGARSESFYRRLAATGYALGLPLAAISAWQFFVNGFDPVYTMRVGNLPNYIGSVLVALGHIGVLLLVAKSGALRALRSRFEAVGRTALSNYLLHSIVMTSVFYGYGLGLYGELPRLVQMLPVVLLIAAQLALSPWWLSKYRFGPVEHLWRSLSYWRWQPMRRP
ncbi:MAG: DUF418 domain-containing protein [Pseudomonadota bacterium]